MLPGSAANSTSWLRRQNSLFVRFLKEMEKNKVFVLRTMRIIDALYVKIHQNTNMLI